MRITHEKISTEKLREIISHMKWRQVILAEEMGVGQKTMSFWMRGIKNPGPDNQKKIDIAYSMVMRGDLFYRLDFLRKCSSQIMLKIVGKGLGALLRWIARPLTRNYLVQPINYYKQFRLVRLS